jgi:hypothetical protein
MDLKTEDRVIARATSGLYAMHLHFSSPSPSFEKKIVVLVAKTKKHFRGAVRAVHGGV